MAINAAGLGAGAAAGAGLPAMSRMSTLGALGAAAAITAGVGLFSYAVTRDDGRQHVHRRYSRDYDLEPTSQDAATHSIERQRTWNTVEMVGGAAALGVGMLLRGSMNSTAVALVGAGVLGHGLGSMLKLKDASGASRTDLPEHTAVGGEEMHREYHSYWGSPYGSYDHAYSGRARYEQARAATTQIPHWTPSVSLPGLDQYRASGSLDASQPLLPPAPSLDQGAADGSWDMGTASAGW